MLDNIPKKENGITLIALVITIIVMLILAGVTISVVVNRRIIQAGTKCSKPNDKG